MFCGKCGKENLPDNNFCSFCGAKIEEPALIVQEDENLTSVKANKPHSNGPMYIVMTIYSLIILFLAFVVTEFGNGLYDNSIDWAHFVSRLGLKTFKGLYEPNLLGVFFYLAIGNGLIYFINRSFKTK